MVLSERELIYSLLSFKMYSNDHQISDIDHSQDLEVSQILYILWKIQHKFQYHSFYWELDDIYQCVPSFVFRRTTGIVS